MTTNVSSATTVRIFHRNNPNCNKNPTENFFGGITSQLEVAMIVKAHQLTILHPYVPTCPKFIKISAVNDRVERLDMTVTADDRI